MGLPPTKEKNLKPQNVGPTPLSLVIFQCGIVSHKKKKILSLKIWRSDFAFMDQMFRLHLHHIRFLHNKRSDFAFILIRCSDFICITFASTADQTFRRRLLHRRSDFASIWIRCSDFICITFAGSADQTFRLRLLHIRRSDFAFIWIRCSYFICITFIFCVSGVQTSSLYGSDVQTSSAVDETK